MSGGRNYSCDKWGPPTKVNEVRWQGGKPHTYCNQFKGNNKCGWNPTHNSAFHQLAMEDSFTLLCTLAKINPDHFLVVAAKEGTQDSTPQSSKGAGADSSRANQKAIVASMM